MDRMFERILVSVDSSADSDKAVRVTADLARRYSAQVVVVHGRDLRVVPPPATGTPMPPRSFDLESEEEARKIVDDAVEALRKDGVEAQGEVLTTRGHIADHILDAARVMDADLIVLGSRGMSRFYQMVIGSVANKIIQLASCPVLLVR
jgi:nucleotide-binding universal stress UspA family protein